MRKKSTKPPARLLAALLACLLLAACGAQPSPQPDPVPDSVPAEPSALTVVITDAQDTLDPGRTPAGPTAGLSRPPISPPPGSAWRTRPRTSPAGS